MNNINDNRIEELAIKYFKGRLPPKCESELYEFINGSAKNRSNFCRLEQRWRKEHIPNQEVESEWGALLNRIGTQEAIKPLFPRKRSI